ncbi:M15 family metallopeptidase [Lysobacter antibioticus]|uniref:D-alanyl-D-alanine carboxypeptidase family protein n=1 Tax=Lysobacter antibioticus TaxID=84531 RepID=A0A0S2F7F7_LYSAN|nr:M15 family metallopeptidase [Lysobacter antibioticus]ALN79493.1 D-alanyl-D-alanine carboxypeptidase family protein [Lysobacter antibioticus]
MPFQLSAKSRERLKGVHPDLRRVVERAIELTTVDFVVTQGNRTQDEQDELYAQGRTKPGKKVTWTRNSRHIGGFAVDVAPWVCGGIEWDDDGRIGVWPRIAEAFKAAAAELGVPIKWGGDWLKTKDRPHFELPADRYPA